MSDLRNRKRNAAVVKSTKTSSDVSARELGVREHWKKCEQIVAS